MSAVGERPAVLDRDLRGPTAAPPSTPRRIDDWLGTSGPARAKRRGSILRRLLALIDFLAFATAVIVAIIVTGSGDGTLFWALAVSPVWILVLKLHDLYDRDHRRIRHSTVDEVPAMISACALGTVALGGLLALSPAGPLQLSTALVIGLGAFAGTIIVRAAMRLVWHATTEPARGVIVGAGGPADLVARRLAVHPEARLELVGYLGPDANGARATELPRLGSLTDIARVASEHGIERVVVSEQDLTEDEAELVIGDCKLARLGLTLLPAHHKLLGPGIELNRLAELPVLDFRFSDSPRSTIMLKRIMDLVISGTALILVSPVLLAACLLVKLDSRGPILYRQTRIGRGGRPFTMLKFRTMVTSADQELEKLVDLARLEQPAFKIRDDPRVTRAGRLLRRSSVDELPQLLNVLRGDMSLVGPRPEEEAVVELYNERQRVRLAVKPGLTGPMQVYGRGELSFEERLALERDYLDNISIAGDLAILLRTPRAIIRGDGAY